MDRIENPDTTHTRDMGETYLDDNGKETIHGVRKEM
jgi:hypothetical protein